jgi:hypothetical protein
MLPPVKALLLALVVQLALPVLAANELEQTVTPITPSQQQRVETLSPGGEQRVERLDAEGVQGVGQASSNPAKRSAGVASKVAIGVMAFVVSVGATVATLMFI